MKFFILYLLMFFSIFLQSFSNKKTELKTRYRINEKGEKERIIIYYDSYDKPIKEIIYGKKNNIKYSFMFSDYTRDKKPLKATILDFNSTITGYLEFKYSEEKLIKIIMRDKNKKAEKISIIKNKKSEISELSISADGELLYKRNYKMDDVIKVNKFNEEKIFLEVLKNDEDFIHIVEYDLSKRLKFETIKEKKTGVELYKFEFKNYNLNGKPIRAVIRKNGENVIGYFEFEYFNNGRLNRSIQYNLKNEIVNISEYKKIGKDYIKDMKNEFGDIINEVSYKMDDKIIIKEQIDNIFYQNEIKDNENLKKREEDFFIGKFKENNFEEPEKKIDIKIVENSKEIIGETKINLNKNYEKTGDTILAEIITDSLKAYAKSDIVFFPNGSIRKGISKGNISNRDIFMIFDPDDKLYLLKVKGYKILDLLNEESLLLRNSDDFLNTAGLTWEISNGIISKVMIDGYEIDRNKDYSIAANNYIAKGLGIYSILTESKKVDTEFSIYKIVSMYIKNIKEIDSDYLLEERRIIKN